MSKSTLLQSFPVYAVATAMAVIGLLPAAAPAQADSACTQYGFPGDFALKQSNGYGLSFVSNGPTATGEAIASAGGDRMNGVISGGITGRNVNMTVTWATFPSSSRGVYNGKVGPDGIAHGITFDAARPSSTANWDALIPLACVTQASTRQLPPAQPFPQLPFGGGF